MASEFVWLPEDRVYAEIINYGAFYSQVRYTKEGVDYDITISNDEFEYFGGDGIDYESY